MKTILIALCLLISTASIGQELRKKKIFLNIGLSGQEVIENQSREAVPVFEFSNKNIDVHFKFGRFLLREKIIVGLGVDFRQVNTLERVPRISAGEEPEYREANEIQIGFFTRYRIYQELFIEGYLGFFGFIPNAGLLPKLSIGPITKYKFGLGYSLQLWHFLAIEPSISFLNHREIYRGIGTENDQIGQISYGLGIAFKL